MQEKQNLKEAELVCNCLTYYATKCSMPKLLKLLRKYNCFRNDFIYSGCTSVTIL